MSSDYRRIAAPVPPALPQPHSFPIMATIAPVVVSLAIWLVTKSAFALIFAALGPAVAIASLADARFQSRRRLRRESTRFLSELAAASVEIEAAHDRERTELAETLPSARRLVTSQWREPERWLATFDDPVLIGVGTGQWPSSVSVEGATVATRSRDDAHDQLRRLIATAGTLSAAPLVVDARLGVGVVGARVPANAVARGLVVQALASLSPGRHRVLVQSSDLDQWRWLEHGPHGATFEEGQVAGAVIRIRAGTAGDAERELVLAVAATADRLPTEVRVVLVELGSQSRIAQHPDRTRMQPLRLHPVSREDAIGIVRAMAVQAARSGFADAELPDAIGFDQCAPTGRGVDSPQGSLSAVVAVTARGPLRLDLVAQGPHAIVGGTTGSGKSELLTAWILAIAHDHPPSMATVLLVDFKGGSAFASLEALPHCVGMITDLDEVGAQRALESLSAELRRRERHLAVAGAKSIDTLAAENRLPRLVIVVDEFAAMVSGFPELHTLFADIAARGRSLGVHLILCTQRPAGVIRDSVLANSAMRLSLRVNNRADSSAVIGTDAAASLPVEPRGRAFVSTDGAAAQLAQFPLVTQSDIDRVTLRWSAETARPHRPWLDPLPAVISLELARASAHDGIPFGLLDDPGNQAQPVAVYRPIEHGNLLVVGAAASGKSTVLATLANSAAVQRVPPRIEGAWDVLLGVAAQIRSTGLDDDPPPRLVFIDDLDALLARFPEDYESAVLELVTRGMREGPARGIHWVVTAQRLTPALHPVVGLCGSRLLLRLPNRQEHVLAGGDGGDFIERLPPGAGRWQGLRVQSAIAQPVPTPTAHGTTPPAPPPLVHPSLSYQPPTQQPPTSHPPTAVALAVHRPLAIVSSRPADFVARLRRSFPSFAEPGAVAEIGVAHGIGVTPAIGVAAPGVTVTCAAAVRAIIGDVDAWQGQWGALAAARATHMVIIDGCGASEFRAVTRLRALPPVIDDTRGDTFWVLAPDGMVTRATLPVPTEPVPT